MSGNKLTLQHCIDWGKDNGWECEDDHYKSSKARMTWVCIECNYKRFMNFTEARLQPNCKKCDGAWNKLTLQDCIDWAEKNGWECLEKEYKNIRKKMRWRHKKCGQEKMMSFINIRNKQVCSKCWEHPHKLSLDDCHKLVENESFKCIATEYIDNSTPILWECEICGYQWEACYNAIQGGSGCPICGAQKRAKSRSKYLFKDFCNIAKENAFKCIEDISLTKIIKARTKLLCECIKCKKISKRSINNFQNNSPCSYCNKNLGENILRELMEQITGLSFPTCKPDFLKIKKGSYLELDGYSESKDHKIAFEHQGMQHYEYIPYINKSKKKFKQLQERDQLKRKLCKENGVKLLEIKDIICATSIKHAIKEILKFCKKNKITIINENPVIDVNKIPSKRDKIIENLTKLINVWGVQKSNYEGANTPIAIECKFCGETSLKIPSQIRRGQQCGKCMCRKKQN